MRDAVPAALRERVMSRAYNVCEYCLIHQRQAWYSHQIDHIISRKHGGRTAFENLALACAICNNAKGTDLGSLTRHEGSLIRFYHPRKDQWGEHFRLEDNGAIHPITEVGEVTCKIFGFNSRERLLERRMLLRAGDFPSIEAMTLLRD
ncbi:HNH endonuclease [Prosthecobacter sp.]|uniref:HNH endonuclease n=1 Tax=Prosthecobacter sp. TaxID=1965333 RepID=UPI00378343DB